MRGQGREPSPRGCGCDEGINRGTKYGHTERTRWKGIRETGEELDTRWYGFFTMFLYKRARDGDGYTGGHSAYIRINRADGGLGTLGCITHIDGFL